MTNEIQKIKPELSEEFFYLVNNIDDKDPSKEDKQKKLNRLEEIIKQEKINPAQIETAFHYSLVGWMALIGNKTLFNMLLKYTDDSKKPDQLNSVWHGLAQGGHVNLIKNMIKTGDFTHINTPNSSHKTPISMTCEHIFSKFKKGKYPNSLTPEKVFSPALTLLLESGANINTFHTEMHFLSVLLDPYKNSRKSLQINILEKAYQFGFDANLIFDKKTENNFIQDLLLNRSSKSFAFIDSLSLILTNTKIDYFYKNKKGETVLDIVNHPNLKDIKPLFEQGYLNLSIEGELDKKPSVKKRL